MKTETYNREQIASVLQVRANTEGLKLGPGVLERLAIEGEKASLRYCLVYNQDMGPSDKAFLVMHCIY